MAAQIDACCGDAVSQGIVDALLGGIAKAQGRLHLQVTVHMEAG
jgi:hypothetical protein